jgi:hypothetical protein
MHPALMGALVGAGLAILLYVADYMMIHKGATERARRKHKNQPVVLDNTERKRLRSLAMFCLLMPPAFALGFWMVS